MHVQVRTLRAAVLTKDKALAKGADDLARQQERAVKAEREYLVPYLPAVTGMMQRICVVQC